MGLAQRTGIASHGEPRRQIEERSIGLLLDERGKIADCDGAVMSLFGYERRELASRHISLLLPQLGIERLIKNDEINPATRFRFRIGTGFVARRKDGCTFEVALCLVNLGLPGKPRLRLIVREQEQGI